MQNWLKLLYVEKPAHDPLFTIPFFSFPILCKQSQLRATSFVFYSLQSACMYSQLSSISESPQQVLKKHI